LLRLHFAISRIGGNFNDADLDLIFVVAARSVDLDFDAANGNYSVAGNLI